jgi:prevent-host-death family protein
MNTVERSYAKARFNTLLADIARTGESVTITYRGGPVAALTQCIRVHGDSVSFRFSPRPFQDTGTEDAGGQNDWAGMARIAAITVSGRD